MPDAAAAAAVDAPEVGQDEPDGEPVGDARYGDAGPDHGAVPAAGVRHGDDGVRAGRAIAEATPATEGARTAPHRYRAGVHGIEPEVGVPSAALASFRRLTGIDLGFVPISRDRTASVAAAEVGARAFTRAGTVFVPPEAGPLDRPDNEALLGHELTHVAQQRMLGRSASGSAEHLEQAAVAVEQAFRGEPIMMPSLDAASAGPGLTWPSQPPAAEPPQRAPVNTEAIPAQQPQAYQPQIQPEPAAQRLAELLASINGEASAEPVQSPVPLDTFGPEPEQAPYRLDDEHLGGIAGSVAQRLRGRFVAVDDPDQLDALATRLYGRLRSRLGRELLVDRERGGLLNEFS